MSAHNQMQYLITFLTLRTLTSAADCNLQQPRKESDPSRQNLSNELRGPNNSLLNTICTEGFPPLSDTISTWNTGSVVYIITRYDASRSLQNCFAAFDNIITQCISGANYWGGD